MKRPRTFKTATEAFLKSADWLGDDDLPAIITLQKIAAQLDEGGLQAALVAQYGVTYRSLLKQRPAGEGDDDDPAAELIGLPGGAS